MTESLQLSPWLTLQLLSKVVIYLSTAAVTGGGFIYLLNRQAGIQQALLSIYLPVGAFFGICSIAINFLAQVGDFNSSGFAGMFDREMAGTLWETSIGTATASRVIGFSAILIAIWLLRNKTQPWREITSLLLYLFALASIGYGFSCIGHISEKGYLLRVLIGTHIIAALGWAGTLLPLWQLNKRADAAALQQLMLQFGVYASLFVALLLGAGCYTLAELLYWKIAPLFSSPYGIMFSLKITVVGTMLLLAANHKLRLVPNMQTSAVRQQLGRSLGWEMLFALTVIILSALFTTALGPET